MPDYGAPTEYERGKTLTFPDFSLEFLGERHTPSTTFPPGFRRWDFRIAGEGDQVLLSWSNGTGHIAPQKFEFRRQSYYLEMMAFVELGRLTGNQVVLWQAAALEERLRARGFL